MSKCDYQKSDCDCGSSSSGFIFGLICGAIIGAIIAVIIYKNNKAEVFEKLEKKIKSFFENLIPQSDSDPTTSHSSKTKPSVKKLIAASSLELQTTKPEITPIFIKPKKPVPKTFIKPKK